jgi:hypothetical protein
MAMAPRFLRNDLHVLLLFTLSCSAVHALVEPPSALGQDAVPGSVRTDSVRPLAETSAQKHLGDPSELTRYDFDLELIPLTKRFLLTERVRFVQREAKPLSELAFVTYADASGVLRSDGSEAVQLSSGRCEPPHDCRVQSERHGITRVHLERPLKRGEVLTVVMTLDGELPRISPERASFQAQTMETLSSLLSGAQAKDFGILAANDEMMSLGGFYAVLAPRRNGHWDTHTSAPIGDLTSDDVFHVTARVRAPSDMRVITPGITVAVRDLGHGVSEHEVHAALVRDFAVMASDRVISVEQSVGDVTVRAHVLPHSQASSDRVLRAACDSLALFEQTFGPYPYRELDVVEAPLVGGVGGVEFSGLVTVAQMLLEPTPGLDAQGLLGSLGLSAGGMFDSLKALLPDPAEMLDMVVAHEVAHQWWHVLVGSDSRREPFVDEGLAQWSALYFMERARGADMAKHAEQQLVLSYQTMRMLGEQDAAAHRPAEAFHSMLAYGGIVYGKAPLVYRELRQRLGDQAFLDTLRAYTERYAFARAERSAFIDMLARKRDAKAVRALARRWLDEAHGDHDLGTFSLGGADLGGLDLGGLLRGNGQGVPDLMKRLEQILRSSH